MSAHSRHVILSRPARDDFRDILAVADARGGERETNTYGSAIQSALEHLASFPSMGRLVAGYGNDRRRFPVREHVIYYEADENELRVARILHGRTDAFSIFSVEADG